MTWEAPIELRPSAEGDVKPAPSRRSTGLNLVRAVYIIPYDRAERSGARQAIKDVLMLARGFFADQLRLYGYGNRSFNYEDDPSQSGTALIHVVQETNPTYTAAWFRGADAYASYFNLRQRAAAAGYGTYPAYNPGEVWLIVGDIHQFNSDGTVIGVNQAGAGGDVIGGGGGTGVSQSFSLAYAMNNFGSLADLRNFQSQSVDLGDLMAPYNPPPGPYDFVYNITAPWYDGSTISQVASSSLGSLIHELSHGFGLFHDFKLDANAHGNLMGNGFRGIRGWYLPDSFPADHTRLSYSAALMLGVNRFFTPASLFGDNTPPTIQAYDSGDIAQDSQGLLHIGFTAQDSGGSGLAVAVLQSASGVDAELPLSGNSGTWAFDLYDYNPDADTQYMINVYDGADNAAVQTFHVTPRAPGHNLPPMLVFKASRNQVLPGETITLDSSATYDRIYNSGTGVYDPNYGTQLNFTWDLDGNGSFETDSGHLRQFQTSFPSPGIRMVRMRAADAAGFAAVSPPMPIETIDHVISSLIYAKFDWSGLETGSQWYPFNTLPEALGAVTAPGTVRIFAGSTFETPRITQQVRLEATGGSVRIGAANP
jgi:hypothetical protein